MPRYKCSPSPTLVTKPLHRRQLLCSALAAASGGLGLSKRATAANLRKPIVINRSKIAGGAHSTIPILIRFTDPDLRRVEQAGQVTSATGDTLFFTAGDRETPLPHEPRLYQPDTGRLEAWVRIPKLTSSADARIYLQQRSSPQGRATQPGPVWDAHYKLAAVPSPTRRPTATASSDEDATPTPIWSSATPTHSLSQTN